MNNASNRLTGAKTNNRGFNPQQMAGAFVRNKELDQYKLGSEKRPALLLVSDDDRKAEVEKICAENEWHCTVVVDKDRPEDVADLEILQNPVETIRLDKAKTVGRNDSCTCGSGKKYKKCCGK